MFLKSAMWNALLAVVPMIALSVQAHKSWMPGMIKFEPNGDYTCTNQDEHCIFVNGNRYGYSFEFTNGLNPADLTCAKRIEGRPGQVAYYTGESAFPGFRRLDASWSRRLTERGLFSLSPILSQRPMQDDNG